MDNMSSEYDDISDAAGIKRVTLKLAVFKAAAKQLHVSWTVAVRELAKANEGRQKALEQSEMDKKRKIDGDKTGLGKKPKKRARPHTALEVIQNLGKDIKTTAMEHWESAAAAWIQSSAEIEVAEPYIVTAVSWVKALVEDEDSQVAKSLREFVEEFKESEVRTKAGRCMRRSLDEASSDASANDFLLNKLYPLNPKGSVCSPAVSSDTEMVDFEVFGAHLHRDTFLVEWPTFSLGHSSGRNRSCDGHHDVHARGRHHRDGGQAVLPGPSRGGCEEAP